MLAEYSRVARVIPIGALALLSMMDGITVSDFEKQTIPTLEMPPVLLLRC